MEASCCLAGQVEVEQVRICYGGVAPKCIMATNAQAALEGQAWSQATLDAALLAVAKDVNITPDAPGLAATAATAAVATVALCCAVLCCDCDCAVVHRAHGGQPIHLGVPHAPPYWVHCQLQPCTLVKV